MWQAAKSVLKYLGGTATRGLLFSAGSRGNHSLVGSCDSNWGGNRDTGKSTTSYIFKVNNNTASWKAKDQSSVAQSSTEAEYYAMADAGKEALFLRMFLETLGLQRYVEKPTPIYGDNQGAISLVHNPTHHSRTKHIALRWHFIRDKVKMKELSYIYIPTEHNTADLLTKFLDKVRYTVLRDKVLGDN